MVSHLVAQRVPTAARRSGFLKEVQLARSFILFAVVLAALATGLASPAHASYVMRDETGGVVLAARGEINHVSVAYEPASGVYVIQDTAGIKPPPGLPIFERFGCTARSPTVVACAWSGLTVQLGDGDDRLTVTGGAAPRTVKVRRVGKNLRGYEVEAPLGVTASGGPGNDTLIGNVGADSFAGAGAWDDIGSPEELADSLGKDTLVGGDGPDTLAAGAANDRVDAGEGADLMAGGDGNDSLDGGPGDDAIASPDAGNDRLLGGPGNDLIYPYNGRDTVDAGPGDDRIFSLDDLFTRSGGSTIVCGPGNDWFEPEASDVASGCEQLFEEWPVTVRLCRTCAFMVEAKIGSRVFSVGRLRVALSPKKLWGVIPLSRRARALVRSRGSLRVRLVGMSGARGAYARDWFVLKR